MRYSNSYRIIHKLQYGAKFGDFIPKIILPSANAASLSRYGEILVRYYSGLPIVSIPIHIIKVGATTLPLTLDYHSSGIRVAEEASCVGLCCSLNSGDLISGNIIGKMIFW